MKVGADVGGTFTDIVLVDEGGRISARKVPSTPHAFEAAVVEGSHVAVTQVGSSLEEVGELRHGTTVATNAVLERSGPVTGLVTTRGFRDVLELGRLRTPTLYDLDWQKPVPLARRRYRLEVDERIDARGQSEIPPDLAALERPLRKAVSEGLTTIAVSLLNAYRNNAHEELVAAWLAEHFPELDVTVATEFVREIGEYERTSTAVANAYLRPVVSRYLCALENSLSDRRCRANVLVMQSSGGMMPVAESARFPAHLLESGPAAGVLAAADVARRAGTTRAISFDMGGTTAKAALLQDYRAAISPSFSVGSGVSASSQLLKGGGYAVALPVVDLAEVGAGGGSIARVDAAGGLEVGPRSAGAVPGPACYSRGGELATVTDANLLLGYLNADGLRESGIDVDVERARVAIGKYVAEPLGIKAEEAALAIHELADRQMSRVLRAVTTERGKDIGAHALIAFGGSGPLHAATLAETVGIETVLVPPLAGVHSAVGLLTTPFELTTSETLDVVLSAENDGVLRERTSAIAASTQQRFTAAGAPSERAAVRQILDLRYSGQASELSIEVAPGLVRESVTGVVERFVEAHHEAYGYGLDNPVTVVRVLTTVTGATHTMDTGAVLEERPATRRRVRFHSMDMEVEALSRAAMRTSRSGPLLIDDADTTTLVPPGWMATLEPHGILRLERES